MSGEAVGAKIIGHLSPEEARRQLTEVRLLEGETPRAIEQAVNRPG